MVRELAARLEVDQRSVRRYITMLQDLGIPVVSERGCYGGYRLKPGYKLPPLMFTDDEALAVTLGLLVARRLGLIAAAPAVEGVLAKLDRVLPEVVREQVQAVQETVAFDVPAVAPSPDAGTVSVFSVAIRNCRRLRLWYQSLHGATEGDIDPYGLVYRKGTWYAVGWCHLRSALRVFRLDRVQRVAMLDETFERPDDFDSWQYVQQSLANMPNTWTVEVLLETRLEEIQCWVSPVLGALEMVPEGVLLRGQTGSLARMAHYLAGLPWRLVVRHPVELAVALQSLAARLTHDVERSLVQH